MRQAVIYPSTQAHLIIKGGKEKCRSLSTEHIVSIGKRGDKAAILQIFENMRNEVIYRQIRGARIKPSAFVLLYQRVVATIQ